MNLKLVSQSHGPLFGGPLEPVGADPGVSGLRRRAFLRTAKRRADRAVDACLARMDRASPEEKTRLLDVAHQEIAEAFHAGPRLVVTP